MYNYNDNGTYSVVLSEGINPHWIGEFPSLRQARSFASKVLFTYREKAHINIDRMGSRWTIKEDGLIYTLTLG